jgi:recombination protein RecR
LSALDGVSPDDLGVEALLDRVKKDGVTEVILALPVTVEGQTTSHYLADMLADFKDVEVYMLAQGIPVGGELDYLDDGTIATAFKAKKKL